MRYLLLIQGDESAAAHADDGCDGWSERMLERGVLQSGGGLRPPAEGIPPTSHATGLTNVFRDDEPTPCLTPEEALDQAPAVEQQRFKVPRILGED